MRVLIALSDAQLERLIAESEPLDGEYTVDAYEAEPPFALEFEVCEGGVDVTAALELLYDEALEGYYLGESVELEHIGPRLRAWLDALD